MGYNRPLIYSRSLHRIISGFVLALVCGAYIQAQDTILSKISMDEILQMSLVELMSVEVTTASKKTEKIDLTPNVMYVFTQDDIRKRGYVNLKDLFSAVPGLFAMGYNGIQTVGQVRGIAPNDNEKISVMINGHSINNVYEPDYFNGALRIENFERVEIIVGPGSVLYGAQTLCATVNLITYGSNLLERDNSIQLSGGNYGNYSGSMNFRSIRKDGDHLSFTVSASSKNGYDAWPSDANDVGNRLLAGTELVDKLYPSILFIGNGSVGNWSMQFFSQNSQMAELHQHKGAADDGRRYDYIYSMLVRNKYKISESFTNSFEIFGDVKRNIRTSYSVGSGDGQQPNWDIYGNVYGVEEAISHKSEKNYFQAGIQAHLNQHRHNYEYLWYPDSPGRGMISPDTSYANYMRLIVKQTISYNIGFFASDEYTFSEQLKCVAAFRLDYNTLFENDKLYFSPRIAVIYSPLEKLILKFMYNKATRMPPAIGTDLNLLWGKDKQGQLFAPDWATTNFNANKPERLSAYELHAILYQGKFRFALNTYYQELKDYFSWYNPRTNVGDFSGYGFELSVDAKINKKISLWGNYAFAENEFKSSPDVLPYVGSDGIETPKTYANENGESVGAPKHSANIGVDISLRNNISLSIYDHNFWGQPLYRSGDWTYASAHYLNAAFNWLNIGKKKIDLGFIYRNILNNREIISTQWLQDGYMPRGSNFELSLNYRFSK